MKKYLLMILSLFFFFALEDIAFSQLKVIPNNKNYIPLKIRSKPNKKSTVLAIVNNSEDLEIISVNSSLYWFKVKYNNVTGWVNGRFLDINSSNIPEENDDEKRPASSNKIPEINESSSKSQMKEVNQTGNMVVADETESYDYINNSQNNSQNGSQNKSQKEQIIEQMNK